MSPIDDELRTLFSSRTDAMVPAADPLAGIERRARRMRRNRVAASVAGAALAVSAVAVAVPALLPDRDGASRSPGFATEAPSPQATPTGSFVPKLPPPAPWTGATLDPQSPWRYRGDASLIAGSELTTLRADWAAVHAGTTLTPLFGQVYESSGRPEVVFVSASAAGDRWGVATSSESGWSFAVDKPLAVGTKALMAVLPGDEVSRLLVVAGPTTGDIGYAADGRSFSSLPMPYPGIAFRGLEGDTSKDAVRVLDGDGDQDHPVFVGAAPDAAASRSSGTVVVPPAETSSAPTLAARYALDPANPWAYRGATAGSGQVVTSDREQFQTDHGQKPGQQDTPLYAAHLSATTDVAVVLHARSGDNWVSFTVRQGTSTHQVAYQPVKGEDVLSAYVPLDATHGLLIGVVSDQAANLVLQTGEQSRVGGSRTAGIWDWSNTADPQARLAAFATGDIEPYSSQPAT